MKIAVINFSGNVGKSTIARHLVAPRLNNARVIAIESINSDEGIQDGTIRGNQFGELLDVLVQLDDVVVDIGASNVEDFVKLMSQYRGSHEDFDYYIVPTVSKTKQQRDTIATIDALADLGIPAKKIRLVFNMVEHEENVEQVFSSLFQYQADQKNFTLKPGAVLRVNEIYNKLNGSQSTIAGILADTTDFKEQLKATTDSAEKLRLSRLIGIKRLAAGVAEELDAVYKTLLK
jgi:hypothetical protein